MISLRLRLDRSPSLARSSPDGLDEPCHVVARIVPDLGLIGREPAGAPAPPLDVALVLDASGSMSGAPLDAAREAVLRLTDELPPRTRLTVVSFADDVVVHVDARTLDTAGRAEIRAAVASLHTRGCTDLHAGWQTGSVLLEEATAGEGRGRHVIVLSAGRANRGIVDPARLASLAAASRARGITTTCVGVGDHYSSTQLSALAEAGGGSCHDAMDAREIVEILRGEVLSLAEIVAEDVQVEFWLPAGVGGLELAGMPADGAGNRLVVHAGGVRAGAERVVVVRLLFDGLDSAARAPGGAVRATLSFRRPGEPGRITVAAAPLELRFAAGGDPGPRVPAPADAREVLEAWQARIVREVTERNRERAYDRLRDFCRREADPFVAYALLQPATLSFAATVRRLVERAVRPMPERTRKAAKDMAVKIARKERGHYERDRGSLFDQFGDGPWGGA
jgi:Ca-activated chloride channel homolog